MTTQTISSYSFEVKEDSAGEIQCIHLLLSEALHRTTTKRQEEVWYQQRCTQVEVVTHSQNLEQSILAFLRRAIQYNCVGAVSTVLEMENIAQIIENQVGCRAQFVTSLILARLRLLVMPVCIKIQKKWSSSYNQEM